MKVTLIGHYPPPFGGVAALMKQMEAVLSLRGCRVSIFNLGSGRPVGENIVNFDTNNRVLEFFQLVRSFGSWDTDVFHYVSASYRSFWLGAVCIALARLTGRKIVISFVGGAFKDFIRSLSPLGVRVARFGLGLSHAVIACNSEIAEVLDSIVAGKPVHRMSNCFAPCVRDELELPSAVKGFAASHSPLVCSTGAACSEYGLLGAIEALAMLRERYPGVGLVLVLTRYGDSPYEKKLHRAIRSLGLEEHVLVQKNLPDFISLLKRSDALLRSTLADGDSVSVREALFFGVPAVASDTCFRPKGVILFRKDDARDMMEKLSQALEARGSSCASEILKEGEENVEQLLSIYSGVLDSRDTPGSGRRFCARGRRAGP